MGRFDEASPGFSTSSIVCLICGRRSTGIVDLSSRAANRLPLAFFGRRVSTPSSRPGNQLNSPIGSGCRRRRIFTIDEHRRTTMKALMIATTLMLAATTDRDLGSSARRW